MRDGAVSMLGLNLSQWNDLTVVDHERVHDLLPITASNPVTRSDSTLPAEWRARRAFGR